MEVIKIDYPVTLMRHAIEKGLTYHKKLKWAKRYEINKNMFHRIYRNLLKDKRKARGVKFPFGVRFLIINMYT